jgi:hypothetical protein
VPFWSGAPVDLTSVFVHSIHREFTVDEKCIVRPTKGESTPHYKKKLCEPGLSGG